MKTPWKTVCIYCERLGTRNPDVILVVFFFRPRKNANLSNRVSSTTQFYARATRFILRVFNIHNFNRIPFGPRVCCLSVIILSRSTNLFATDVFKCLPTSPPKKQFFIVIVLYRIDTVECFQYGHRQ